MITYEKTHYAVGDKLELLPRGSKPPSRTFSVVNAWFITSIATRLGQVGTYSAQEEQEEVEAELEMVHPSFKYGAAVSLDARPDPEVLDQAKRDQVKAFNNIRNMSVCGESTVHSALTGLSAFMQNEDPEPIKDPKPKVKISTRPKEEREKITSNVKVLGDTGSNWSSVTSGPSLATTTATLRGSVNSGKGLTRLRKALNDRLKFKGKLSSIPPPKVDEISSNETYVEPDAISSGSSDTVTLNQARNLDVDDTLEGLDESYRKRPKNLLLGKSLTGFFT